MTRDDFYTLYRRALDEARALPCAAYEAYAMIHDGMTEKRVPNKGPACARATIGDLMFVEEPFVEWRGIGEHYYRRGYAYRADAFGRVPPKPLDMTGFETRMILKGASAMGHERSRLTVEVVGVSAEEKQIAFWALPAPAQGQARAAAFGVNYRAEFASLFGREAANTGGRVLKFRVIPKNIKDVLRERIGLS